MCYITCCCFLLCVFMHIDIDIYISFCFLYVRNSPSTFFSKHRQTRCSALNELRFFPFYFLLLLSLARFCYYCFYRSILNTFGIGSEIEMICNLIGTEIIEVNGLANSVSVFRILFFRMLSHKHALCVGKRCTHVLTHTVKKQAKIRITSNNT